MRSYKDFSERFFGDTKRGEEWLTQRPARAETLLRSKQNENFSDQGTVT